MDVEQAHASGQVMAKTWKGSWKMVMGSVTRGDTETRRLSSMRELKLSLRYILSKEEVC